MTTPSKIAPAILSVFGLPFLGMGLFAVFAFLNAADQPLPNKIGAVVFASVFAIIGAGLVFGSWYGYSRQKVQAARELASPASPWLWRQDWAASRVESKNKSSAIGWWIATVLVNMLSLPACLAAISQSTKTQDPKYILAAAFEIIGLLVLVGALRATIRLERFGKTYFEMRSLPFSPGGHVAGAIHMQLDADAQHGIDLKLSCLRRMVTGSGDNRSTQLVPLWEDSRNVSPASIMRSPLDTMVPVDFAIPGDALQTDHDNSSDQILWMLKANADVPGVDYSDEFEIPVFRTSQSSVPMTSQPPNEVFGIRTDDSAASGAAPAQAEAEVSEPRDHRVVANELPDGLELYFRAGRNIGRAVLIVSLAIGCAGLFFELVRTDRQTPKLVLFGVGFLAFIMILAAIHAALATTRIVVGNGTISWRRSVIGIPSSARQIPISEVDTIVPVTSIQQASSSGSTLYSLRLKTKDGKNYTLVDDIVSRQEARWIVSQMEKRAGLRLNTQVEVSGSFYGPPPQPGAALPGGYSVSLGGVKVNARSSNNWSSAVAVLFFFAWAGFMVSMVLRMPFSRAVNRSGRAAGVRTRAVTPSVPHFVRTPEMRQASLAQVMAWPAQQQAEELTARALEHDSAALQAFDQSTPQWVGKIHLTDSLRQLEGRGRYSSDLRVRRAEADLELTLDGWPKTPNSVDMLMSQAKADLQVRARSLYFLGILAGDGIETEQAYSFILDYARHDRDPVVRQWGAEGLRFIGTDEALDELFDIFTHDASFAVRDRAGCNISDCGIFKRSQRLRMVPRLIDLISDTHLNTQMRNWSYLALREITDENLPPDAIAWRTWYRDHASTKQTQFAALDWWQVRGDN